MKVVLAGAFGNLGGEILRALCDKNYEVIAADLKERDIEGLKGKYTFVSIDATNPETLKGLCDGAEVVITTMGLTGASTRTSGEGANAAAASKRLPLHVAIAAFLDFALS